MAERVQCLYRVSTTKQVDHDVDSNADIPMQRKACREFVDRIREFWEEIDDGTGPIKENDALIELRVGTKQRKFDNLLVSEFARIGRVPLECSFAAAFFERSGIEVWDTVDGHIGAYIRN